VYFARMPGADNQPSASHAATELRKMAPMAEDQRPAPATGVGASIVMSVRPSENAGMVSAAGRPASPAARGRSIAPSASYSATSSRLPQTTAAGHPQFGPAHAARPLTGELAAGPTKYAVSGPLL